MFEVKTLLETTFFIILVYDCSAITRYSSPRPHQDWIYDEHREFYRPGDRDSRSTVDYPVPQLPWEEALRHSIYLTLVRDKIDAIVTKNRAFGDHHRTGKSAMPTDENDMDLWHEIRRAPFKAHNKERGPIFGDIAILSQGKLIQNHYGMQFVEDENVKECIECHIYSARPNELEAEKMLAGKCNGLECENGDVRALWTVRRIRHRNVDGDKSPFRYELMFSIASARSDNALNYNLPTQTFTIPDSDRSIPKRNEYDSSNDVPYGKQKKNQNYNYNGEQYNPRTEKSYWVHRNINQQGANSKTPILFPEHANHHNHNGQPVLNIGEVYQDDRPNINPHNYYQDTDFKQKFNVIRGSKKYDKADKVLLESESPKHINQRLPTITHLHHHYYLNNDEPIIKLPFEMDNHNYASKNKPTLGNFYEGNNKNIELNNSKKIPILNERDTSNNPSNQQKIFKKTENNSFKKNHESPTKPTTLQKIIQKTNQFKPSPEDIRIRFSEMDPLYPPTLTTLSSQIVDQSSVTYPTTEDKDEPITAINELPKGKFSSKFIPNKAMIEIDENTKSIYASSTAEYSPDVIADETITDPPTKDITSERPTEGIIEKPIGRKKIERPTRRPLRRGKSQKNFFELNAQLPPPDNTGTTLPYRITAVTQTSIDDSDPTQLNSSVLPTHKMSNEGNSSLRGNRRKYYRKPNGWSPKRAKTKLSHTINRKSTTNKPDTTLEEHITNDNDISLNKNVTEATVETNFFTENSSLITEPTINEVININNVSLSEEPLEDHEEIEILTTTLSDQQTDGTYLTPTIPDSSNITDNEEMITTQTKRSFVTSISLKLGNKTQPYFPSSTPPTSQNDTTKINRNKAKRNPIIDGFSEAKVFQINKPYTRFNIFKAEDVSNDNTQVPEDIMDNITMQIVNHANFVSLNPLNITK